MQHADYARAVDRIHQLTVERDDLAATIAKQERYIKNLEAARDAYRNLAYKADFKEAGAIDKAWLE